MPRVYCLRFGLPGLCYHVCIAGRTLPHAVAHASLPPRDTALPPHVPPFERLGGYRLSPGVAPHRLYVYLDCGVAPFRWFMVTRWRALRCASLDQRLSFAPGCAHTLPDACARVISYGWCYLPVAGTIFLLRSRYTCPIFHHRRWRFTRPYRRPRFRYRLYCYTSLRTLRTHYQDCRLPHTRPQLPLPLRWLYLPCIPHSLHHAFTTARFVACCWTLQHIPTRALPFAVR